MENIILKILENNNRIIVPEFGAFIVKQRKPLNIIFNEFLQYNDGVLIKFLADNEGLSRDDAKKQIEDFVSELTQELKKNNRCDLKKLGVLEKNSAGKISIGSSKTETTKQTPGESPTSKSKKETPVEIIEETKTPETQKADDEKADDHTPNEKNNIPTPDAATVPKKEVAGPKTTPQPDNNIDYTQKPFTPPKPEPVLASANKDISAGKEKLYDKPDDKLVPKKRRKTILWIIVLVIVNVGLIFYFILTDQFKGLGYEDSADDTIEFIEEDIVPDQPLRETVPDKPAEKMVVLENKPTKPAVTQPVQHYIVAGVFRSEQNADKLVLELQKQGFNSKKFGKIGNLHAVSYSGYANKDDAVKALREIQRTTNPDAWIRTLR